MARTHGLTSTWLRPVLVNGDHAVLRWVLQFDWQDGSVTDTAGLAY